jgi:hypothetical protein
MIKYCDDKEADVITRHNCSLEWNYMNKTQSWINFFALCLGNPMPIISCTRSNTLLQKTPFRHTRHQRILHIPGANYQFKCPKVLKMPLIQIIKWKKHNGRCN